MANSKEDVEKKQVMDVAKPGKSAPDCPLVCRYTHFIIAICRRLSGSRRRRSQSAIQITCTHYPNLILVAYHTGTIFGCHRTYL
jgi:hypothetical protein